MLAQGDTAGRARNARIGACVGLAAAALALAPAAGARAASLPTVTSGHRPGPDLLYASAASAPQLTNSGIWRAPPILVSGANAYRGGEFLYQDFLYDDHGAREAPDPNDPRTSGNLFSKPNGTYTYPTDARYANNAADLVELRVKPLADATAFRITLNTLKDPGVVAFSIALGGTPGQPHPFPHGANVQAPADRFLTVHPAGSGLAADLVDAASGQVVPGAAPAVALDAARRQIEVRVPHRQWDPGTRTVRLAAGVGLWDAANHRYLLPQLSADATHAGGAGTATAPAAFFNVAFRGDEPFQAPTEGTAVITSAAWWRDRAQGTALASGDISPFFASVDFAKLVPRARTIVTRPRVRACRRCARRMRLRLPRVRGARIVDARVTYRGRVLAHARGRNLRRVSVRRPTSHRFRLRVSARTNPLTPPDDDRAIPRAGPMDRILPSHFELSQGADFGPSCLASSANCPGQYQGRLQPYAVYVPRKPAPARGYGMTLLLHSLSANYNQYSSTRNQSQLGERGPGSIVITTESRGPDENYENYGAADVFDVWGDVARRYRLDPDWTVTSGYSMGGVGTFKLGSQYPDLFARAQPVVGFESNPDVLASLRNVPVLMWNNHGDELANEALFTGTASKLDSLGYRYELDAFQPCANAACSPLFANHLQLAINDQYAPSADFLGTARVDRSPAHVTYVLDAARNHGELGLVGDHAYWLSGLTLRSTSHQSATGDPEGQLDAVSRGFGVGDATASSTQLGSGTLAGGNLGSLTFTRQSRGWSATPSAARGDAIDVNATNIAAAAIDVTRAHVDCRAAINVTTDGPITVTLPGCGRTIHAG